jgi:transglutaminase-like putative cysteine protease
LKVIYKVTAEFEFPVRNHSFILRPEPNGTDCKTVVWSESGEIGFARGFDRFGNITLTGSEYRPHNCFNYKTEFICPPDFTAARISSDEADDIIFSFPSKYTEISEEMKKFAEEVSTAKAMCKAVSQFMVYTPNVTDNNTTAQTAFSMRKGVCQDFSHILISLLRFKGIRARYVKGFKNEIAENGSSHAWVEALSDNEWIALDPTDWDADASRYIKIGIGRDFADCPMERGIFIGGGKQNQRIELKIYD